MNQCCNKCYYSTSSTMVKNLYLFLYTYSFIVFPTLSLRHGSTLKLRFCCGVQFPTVACRTVNDHHSHVTDALPGPPLSPPPALLQSSSGPPPVLLLPSPNPPPVLPLPTRPTLPTLPTRPLALLQNQRQFFEQLPAKWSASEPHYLITSTGRS